MENNFQHLAELYKNALLTDVIPFGNSIPLIGSKGAILPAWIVRAKFLTPTSLSGCKIARSGCSPCSISGFSPGQSGSKLLPMGPTFWLSMAEIRKGTGTLPWIAPVSPWSSPTIFFPIVLRQWPLANMPWFPVKTGPKPWHCSLPECFAPSDQPEGQIQQNLPRHPSDQNPGRADDPG